MHSLRRAFFAARLAELPEADELRQATDLNNLALLYYSQGRYADAEPMYLSAIEIALNTLGQDHPNTQTMVQNFLLFLQQVLQAQRHLELSPHPLTQALLAEVQQGET